MIRHKKTVSPVELRNLFLRLRKRGKVLPLKGSVILDKEANCLRCGLWVRDGIHGQFTVGFLKDGTKRQLSLCQDDYKIICKLLLKCEICGEGDYVLSQVCAECCEKFANGVIAKKKSD